MLRNFFLALLAFLFLRIGEMVLTLKVTQEKLQEIIQAIPELLNTRKGYLLDVSGYELVYRGRDWIEKSNLSKEIITIRRPRGP